MNDPKALLDAMHKLVVASYDHDALVVDAEPLRTDPNSVRYWRLIETSPGVWHHPESGSEASLGEALHSIALVYIGEKAAPPDGAVQVALDALRVRFADGTQATRADSLHLVIDEEGPEALVTTVLDALGKETDR